MDGGGGEDECLVLVMDARFDADMLLDRETGLEVSVIVVIEVGGCVLWIGRVTGWVGARMAPECSWLSTVSVR